MDGFVLLVIEIQQFRWCALALISEGLHNEACIQASTNLLIVLQFIGNPIMGQMADFTVYDDSTTPVAFTYKPVGNLPYPLWRESSSTKSMRAKSTYSEQLVVQNNGIRRRVTKLVDPVMEQASGAAADGNVAPPKVAHEITVGLQIIAHERATEEQLANALKKAVNIALGDATAGTGNAYKNATNVAREFLIKEVIPT